MILRVLGSAAGGGVPQWNCACANCSAARAGAAPARTQSSIALSADGVAWYLINASPDVAAQIEAFEPLQPLVGRDTPIAGMLLTDANVDHAGGLAVVRQQGDHAFVVRSSEPVRALLCAQPAFAPFARPPHRWEDLALDGEPCPPVSEDEPFGSALVVSAVAVPGLMPGYAGRAATRGAVVAYACEDRRSGGRVLFAPVFAAVDEVLRSAIERADVAFLDGSFYSDDEMAEQGLGNKRARDLGHCPVGGGEGSLAALAGIETRCIFTHVNNTNPMLDPDSPAALAVAHAGAELAYDGMELHL